MKRPSRRDLRQLVALLHDALPEQARERLLARLEREPALAEAYARMQAAQRACGALGQAEVPSPSWRELETNLRWRLAQEGEGKRKPATPRWRWALGLGVAAVLGLALGLVISHSDKTPHQTVAPQAKRSTPISPIQPPQPLPREIAALAVLLSGDVTLLPSEGKAIAKLTPQRPLVDGDRVLTGEGGAAVIQWQEATGAQLRPGSELAFSRLTDVAQQLRLFSGEAFFEFDKREPHHRLEIVAGSLRVEVVGTRFSLRLARDYTELQVDEGEVLATPIDERTLMAQSKTLSVRAGQRLRVRRPEGNEARLEAMGGDRRARPYLTRWKGLHRVLATSGLLQLDPPPPATSLRFDGTELDAPGGTLRVAQGRHLVELVRQGRTLERRWVEVGIGATAKVSLRIKVKDTPPKPTSSPAVTSPTATSIHELFRRRAPLIRSCYLRRAKRQPGLSGKVVLRLRVDKAGRATRVQVAKNTLDDESVAQCVRAMVATWAFPKGQAATVTYPFVFRPN